MGKKTPPLSSDLRQAYYERQNGGRKLTARQRRRLTKKQNRLLGFMDRAL